MDGIAIPATPKLTVARELPIPVVMVRRPDPEPGARVESAESMLRGLTRTE